MSLKIRRILAYLFDIIVIELLVSFLIATPLNPNYENMLILQDEYNELFDEYQGKIKDVEDDEDASEAIYQEFAVIAGEYSHKMVKYSIYSETISIVCIVLYFIVFAYFFSGQTVGKRLLKITIADKDGPKVSLKSLIIRGLLLYNIPFNILTLILAFNLNDTDFMTASSTIRFVTIIYELILIYTTLSSSTYRGLHDYVAGTKVVIGSDRPAEIFEKEE